jgi:hypothetical protein
LFYFNDNEKTAWNNKRNFSDRYNDLEDKPTIPTQLRDLQADDYYSTVSRTEKESWSAKSGFSGSYNDLTDKPQIPTDIRQLAQSSPDYQTVSATQKLAWDNKSSFSGRYGDLQDKPDLTAQVLGINNGRLNIKRDGNLLNIFYANSSDDITVDISGSPEATFLNCHCFLLFITIFADNLNIVLMIVFKHLLIIVLSLLISINCLAVEPDHECCNDIAFADKKFNKEDCTCNGVPLYGNVKIVESFADFDVKVVTSFEDLDVKVVESFPDECGKWKFVTSFPDFTVRFVESFPDFTIKYVTSFPGVH